MVCITALRADELEPLLSTTMPSSNSGSISVHARARETLLPILLMPVVLPVLISAVRASTAILEEMPRADWLPWIQLLAVADVIFIAAAYATIDFLLIAALNFYRRRYLTDNI